MKRAIIMLTNFIKGCLVSLVAASIMLFLGCDNQSSDVVTAEGGAKTVEETQPQPLQISGITLLKGDPAENDLGGMAVIYTVNNPNKEFGLSRAKLTVTVKDAQGRVLKTWDNVGLEGSPYSTHYLIAPAESHEYVYDIYDAIKGAEFAEVAIEQDWLKLSKEDLPKIRLLSIDAWPE